MFTATRKIPTKTTSLSTTTDTTIFTSPRVLSTRTPVRNCNSGFDFSCYCGNTYYRIALRCSFITQSKLFSKYIYTNFNLLPIFTCLFYIQNFICFSYHKIHLSCICIYALREPTLYFNKRIKNVLKYFFILGAPITRTLRADYFSNFE